MKKINLSIGIPVYNEEHNIRKLLWSIINQSSSNFRLKEIIVISDGSTDRTVKEIRKISERRIKLIISPKRNGQNYQINRIFEIFRSPVLVLFDADTLPTDRYCLENLIRTIKKGKNISLVHGTSVPLPLYHRGFFENMQYFIDSLKEKMYQELRQGQNIYVAGACRAITGNLAAKTKIPEGVSEDSFLYLFCRKNKLKISFQKKSRVYYSSPGNWQDYFRKTGKYNRGKEKLFEYFPQKLIKGEYDVSTFWYLRLLAGGLWRSPFYMLSYLIIFGLTRLYLLITWGFRPFEKVATSTKKLKIPVFYEPRY